MAGGTDGYGYQREPSPNHWKLKDGRVIALVTPEEFHGLSIGTVLYSIDGRRQVVGRERQDRVGDEGATVLLLGAEVMETVHKYPVPEVGDNFISMPAGAVLLHFGVQRGEPMVWARVDPRAESEMRRLRVVGTGIIFSELGKYAGTIQMDGFVWHLFDMGVR